MSFKLEYAEGVGWFNEELQSHQLINAAGEMQLFKVGRRFPAGRAADQSATTKNRARKQPSFSAVIAVDSFSRSTDYN
ncbi:hypothetical protein CISG_04274 [Coccidioides immitis RMSCC 3703]|uniref:Uncharacterized protein n=1 Tax=Coccidioides immitis RMSCC 3703 TaxID=454286 RepID=A0A0J8TLP7_COCIT|nr:hypothetical protein CISG_04274 [Coccidioides immitis RMSCC 3703]